MAEIGTHATDPLDIEHVRKTLAMSPFWKDIIYRRQLGSTNDLAKDLAVQGAAAGTVVVADEQTAGRGRLDRRWIAPPRTSLLCSILFRPDLRPAQAHRLTMLCSLAAVDAVESLADLPVALKWPNDVITRSRIEQAASPEWRKLAGILTETGLVQTGFTFAVVGIGINVNVPHMTLAELSPDATSILAETEQEVNRSALLIELLRSIEERYQRFRSGENPHVEWSARLATLGRRVQVTMNGSLLDGVAEAVDENGALLIRTPRGSLQRLLVGDVTLAQS